MSKRSSTYAISARPVLLLLFLCCAVLLAEAEEAAVQASGPLVKRERRRSLFSGEDGEISAARVTDNINGSYLLHFFTLEPNSLFLPALLHADMIFYVHTGSGKLSWTEEGGELKSMELATGDVYRLEEGSFFFIQSNLETQTQRQKLRIHAFFADSGSALHAPPTNPYSSIRDLFLGFDREVLQAAFKVPKEVVEELANSKNPPAIVHVPLTTQKSAFQMEAQLVKSFIRAGRSSYSLFGMNKNKNKKKKSGATLFNLYREAKDFENCNGWSTTVTMKKLSALKGSDVGLFMVNLTAGSMMGPHWNPMAMEISVVLEGRGMISVVCPSFSNCKNIRFEVEEGDVFGVPRFHPMSQISFNNDSLVFVGFSTSAKRNHPQFLAGQASVLRTLDKDVLAMSFNVSNTTLDRFLAPQEESVILGCLSCAEEELRIVREETERGKEEAKEREKEESEKVEEERRKEEEARKKEEEEEEKVKREEEEERKKEEAAKKEEEEERKRKEEAVKREEEEEARREEERQREEEKAKEREREEEEARRKQQEEEAKSHREEEEKGGRSEGEQAAEEERSWEEDRRKKEGWGRIILNKRLTV